MKIKIGDRRSFRGTVVNVEETGDCYIRLDGAVTEFSGFIVTHKELAASRPLVKRKRVVIRNVQWALVDWTAFPIGNMKVQDLVDQKGTLIWIPDEMEETKPNPTPFIAHMD